MGAVMRSKHTMMLVNQVTEREQAVKKLPGDTGKRNMKVSSTGKQVEIDTSRDYDPLLAPTKRRVAKKVVPGRVTHKDVLKLVTRAIMRSLLLGDISYDVALRQLRLEVLNMKQQDYANMVSVSRKTISDIENGTKVPSVEVINKVFKPFGLELGLIPKSKSVLRDILNGDGDSF